MKNIFKCLTIITFTTIIFSCDVDITPTNNASDSGYLSGITASEAKENNISGTNFEVTGIVATADDETLNSVTYDVITISFGNGQVDDTTTNLANIVVYPLTDSGVATTPNTRGTAVTFDFTTVTTSGDTSTVKLKMANTSTTFDIADPFEVVVTADLTAYDEAISLNQDGDNIEGEANDDVYVETVVSTGLTGKDRNLPSFDTFTVGFDNIDTTGDITYNIGGGLSLDTFSADSVDGDVVVEQYDYTTHTWSAITVTTSYDGVLTSPNVGDLTIDLPAASNGDVYRWQLTESAISQDSTLIASDDYLVKYEVENDLVGTITNNAVIDTGSYFSTIAVSTNPNNVNGNKYIDVNFTSGITGDILADTLTENNIKFSVTAGSVTKYIDFDSVEETFDNVFRFYFTTGENITGMTTTIFPTVMEDAGTSASTADDLHVGDSGNYLAVITI